MHKGITPFLSRPRGYFVVIILVFGAVFLFVLVSLMGLVIAQKRASGQSVNNELALHIAEAGLEYYRWYLAHNPGDITNGTAGAQPFIHRYSDPESGEVGQFELTVASSQDACGYVGPVDITSVGRTDASPENTRTVYGRYARPTVADFSYVLNAPYTLIGEDHEITGPYHSNGSIEMDGVNNSIMTSAKNNGIYGDGPNDHLWQFPVPPADFVGLSVDLTDMKTSAQSVNRYWGPSGRYGYKVEFKANGTFDLYTVRSTYTVEMQISDNPNWFDEDNVINSTRLVGNYTIPTSCGLLFFEDRVWVEGVISGKVTIAAANLISSSIDASMILTGDITYATDDGSAGFLAIAEESVLIPINSPDDMELNGIFIAQNGYFGRNHYNVSHTPSGLEYGIKRDTLTINGTIVSKGRVGTKWMSGDTYLSGYDERFSSYSRDLVDNPPPLVPATSVDYAFTEWREVFD